MQQTNTEYAHRNLIHTLLITHFTNNNKLQTDLHAVKQTLD